MTTFRAVLLDAKEHSENPRPTFMRESIGKWDSGACEENDKRRDEGHLRPGPTVVPFNNR